MGTLNALLLAVCIVYGFSCLIYMIIIDKDEPIEKEFFVKLIVAIAILIYFAIKGILTIF